MTLRALTADDWRAFDDIRSEMLAEHPSAFGSTLADWQARSAAEKRDWMGKMRIFAILAGARCLSVAAYYGLPGRRAGHRATVISVYSRPEARRQGHVGRLLEALSEDARANGFLQLELETPSWNAGALTAYRRAGFQQTGIVPRAMRSGEGFDDDVLMVKALDGADLRHGDA